MLLICQGSIPQSRKRFTGSLPEKAAYCSCHFGSAPLTYVITASIILYTLL